MTIRISLLPYGPSDSCTALRNAIREEIDSGRLDASITLLRSEGSRYVARPTDVVINYGNRRYPESFFGRARVLNSLPALNRAANKLQALNTMAAAGVPTIEYTTQQQIAQGWVGAGDTVYSRAVLNGHSGEGITVHNIGDNPTVPAAPLYTKGITSQRREWRVHVFGGVITYVQKKIRRNGYREDPNYREDVRNHHTGWVYSNQFTDRPSDAVLRSAFDAVNALGLDFGAVDVISRQDQAWVLEVNTAPGLTGTTLETYQHNFSEFVRSISTNSTPDYRVAYPTPERVVTTPVAQEEATVAEEATPAAAPVEAPVGISMPQTQVEQSPHRDAAEEHHRPLARSAFGMYLADLMNGNGNGGVSARNVIVYVSNGCIYRHGWNLPLAANSVRNLRRINSVTLENSQIIEL